MTVHQKTCTSTNTLAKSKRIIIKIGSSLLVDTQKNELKHPWLLALVEDIAALRAQGAEIVIVTSGSVAMGRRILHLDTQTLTLDKTQAAAACGQVHLMKAYQHIFGLHGIEAAQILLTLEDTENRQAYLNVRATLQSLLALNVIPVINENDTVAAPLHRYGDNDRLAARIAAMVQADSLILLSDIDGLYTADPSVDEGAQFIPTITALTPEIQAMGGDSRSGLGRGGMRTKIEAARIALSAGCAMVIAQGKKLHAIRAIMEGERCSWFLPQCTPAAARKVWIAGSLDPRGTLTIDDGAVQALQQGRSLLPVGVKAVTGSFARGDLVSIQTADRTEIARGLIAYSAEETQRIAGQHSNALAKILGYHGPQELIHRDDLALIKGD